MSLYLVDGHALAYRSYYAFIRRPLTNSKGQETSAVFGFVKTMLTLFEKHDPSHVAVVFDAALAVLRAGAFFVAVFARVFAGALAAAFFFWVFNSKSSRVPLSVPHRAARRVGAALHRDAARGAWGVVLGDPDGAACRFCTPAQAP